jgi:ketosteroid isomerase-like protein
MADAIRTAYAARVGGDIDGTMALFADDAVFGLNARGTPLGEQATGKEQIRAAIQQLIDGWRFEDWKEISLLIEGDTAMLHWTARITCLATGKSEIFDVFDCIKFSDGKVVHFKQSTDTAMIMSLAAA